MTSLPATVAESTPSRDRHTRVSEHFLIWVASYCCAEVSIGSGGKWRIRRYVYVCCATKNGNVCLWDTLMPHRSCLVQGFTCHESGSPAIVYAPQQQLLISSGRKGDICIFDVRQRQLRHTFQAHESAVKCLALDPTEEFFVTGSVDGEVKVWGLLVHNLLYSFPAEHMRTSIFRNLGAGVTQLHLGPTNHMFSCGADGTLKWRLLPDRDNLLQTL